MVINFTLKQNGNRVSVDNKAAFDSLIISEGVYEALKSTMLKGQRKTVFDTNVKGIVDKIAYAAVPNDECFFEVLPVYVVSVDGAIKLIFGKDEEPAGVQMYIEDGDKLYTTFTEAQAAADELNSADAPETDEGEEFDIVSEGEKLLDTLNDVAQVLGDKVKDGSKTAGKVLGSFLRKLAEEYAEDRTEKENDVVSQVNNEVVEDEQPSTPPTEKERIETQLGDFRAKREALLKQNSAVLNQLKSVKSQIAKLEVELAELEANAE